MDIICALIFAFYFIRGCWKGFVSTLFSLVDFFAVALLAFHLTKYVLPVAENFMGGGIYKTIETYLNGAISGSFSSLAEFEAALGQSKFGVIFSLIFSKILPNLQIDGTLSAGQILAPTLTNITLKVLSFLILFLAFEVVLKILRVLVEKFIKKFGLSYGNRILGGILGIVKGLFVFGLVFAVLTVLANALASEWLLNFVGSGNISRFIYNNFVERLIGLFY